MSSEPSWWGMQAQSEPLTQPAANLGAPSSLGAMSASGPSHESVREAELAYSGALGSSLGKGSGGAVSDSGFSWSDVTALLRARSDFSDVEVGPLIGRGSFGRVYKGVNLTPVFLEIILCMAMHD